MKEKEQKERILKLIEKIILRYRNKDHIFAWQVENEPFFSFGKCPWKDEEFLKEEINRSRKLDFKKRKIIISDSGEFSFWLKAAKFGDIVGVEQQSIKKFGLVS
jgi:hypothetical protein